MQPPFSRKLFLEGHYQAGRVPVFGETQQAICFHIPSRSTHCFL